MTTIAAALAITTYMLLSPAHWLSKLMQLTPISSTFKANVLVLGCCYLFLSWSTESYIFPIFARGVGRAKLALMKKAKKRKEYKLILERTRT